MGRAEGALAHPLSVLTEAQLITPLADALKQRRTTSGRRTGPPLASARGRSERGTPRSSSGVEGVVGGRRHRRCPDLRATLQYLARTWCAEYASDDTLGGTASQVAPTVVACREHRENHEVDVVVIGTLPNKADRIIALGEAKWRSHAVGVEHSSDCATFATCWVLTKRSSCVFRRKASRPSSSADARRMGMSS